MKRRELLQRGSLLAVGVLGASIALPRRAEALTPRGRNSLADAVAAILDRPLAATSWYRYYAHCRCEHCERVRQTPYACASCGFGGEPLVFPCECVKRWDEWVWTNAEMLQSPNIKGAEWTKIAAFQRRLRRAGRPSKCSPITGTRCAHTATECPVCGDCGDGDPFAFGSEESGRAAAQMIKDLRALLKTEGH
jgi:hypothetical protein